MFRRIKEFAQIYRIRYIQRMSKPPRQERPLHWVGSSKRDLLEFPEDAIDDFGYGLGVVHYEVRYGHDE